MAKILILSSARGGEAFDPWKHSTALLLQHSAELDAFGQHTITDDPDQADVILFAEMGECGFFAERVRAHGYYRKFPEKCFLFDSADNPFPVLPGIYASLTKAQYRNNHTRTGFYLYVIENPFIQFRPLTGREPFLASFFGNSGTHPVREKVLALCREDFSLQDTGKTSTHMAYHGNPEERVPFWTDYADAMANARFSLCPRGVGAGSIRLFESMKMGRPCVILSDDWQPNSGVDWDAFSIRIPEAEASRIPEILDHNADRAEEMGLYARKEWEKWFSEHVRFHRVVELCLDIQRSRGRFGSIQRLYHLRHIPLHPRRYLSSKKVLFKQDGRILW
jgi:hypothetical protein